MQIFSAGISVPTHLVAAHPDRTELCPHTIHLPAPRPGAHMLPYILDVLSYIEAVMS